MRRARGQAIVEAAIAMMTFLLILMVGIHFAEVGFTQLKVTEAAAAPLWDATAGKMHVYGTVFDETPLEDTLRNAARDANARYQDFDGRSRVNTQGGTSDVFTVADGMTVSCGMGNELPFMGGMPIMPFVYTDNNGVWCNAEARIENRWFPRTFLAGGANEFGLCAFGRKTDGRCAGGVAMLMDDWGLTNSNASFTGGFGNEAAQCPVLPFGVPCVGGNYGYWMAGSSAYTMTAITLMGVNAYFAGASNPASLLLDYAVGPSTMLDIATTNLTGYYLSFVGEELMFTQPLFATDFELPPLWPTTPFYGLGPGLQYVRSYANRRPCYLGQECNYSTMERP
jgi:hypothetical protein